MAARYDRSSSEPWFHCTTPEEAADKLVELLGQVGKVLDGALNKQQDMEGATEDEIWAAVASHRQILYDCVGDMRTILHTTEPALSDELMEAVCQLLGTSDSERAQFIRPRPAWRKTLGGLLSHKAFFDRLSPDQVDALHAHVPWEPLRERLIEHKSAPPSVFERERVRLSQESHYQMDDVGAALSLIKIPEVRTDEDFIQILLDMENRLLLDRLIRETDPPLARRAHEKLRALWDADGGRAVQKSLLASPFTGPDDLLAIYDRIRGSQESVRPLVQHSAATVDVAVAILEDTRRPTVRRQVLSVERFRQSEAVQDILDGTQDRRLLSLLVRGARGERQHRYFRRLVDKVPDAVMDVALLASRVTGATGDRRRRLFQRLVEADPVRATRWLEEAGSEDLSDLEMEDLVSLLAHPDGAIRHAAILATGYVGEVPDRSPERSGADPDEPQPRR